MYRLLILLFLLFTNSEEAKIGWTSRYDPNPMNATIELRQEWGQLPQNLEMYDGFVAVADCDRIGEETYLKPINATQFERFLVVDCAGSQQAYNWMVENNIIVEVDYTTAERWGCLVKSVEIVEIRAKKEKKK